MTDKPKRGKDKPRLSLKEDIARTEAEITRVRAREEQRLIRAADKAGYFRFKLTNAQLDDMFKATIKRLRPNLSSLAREQNRKAKFATQQRKNDGRRKALLGSFLVAQCRHKPDLHAKITEDIRAFLSNHPTKTVADRNLDLLAGFLADPETQDLTPEPEQEQEQDQTKPSLPGSEYRVARAHRLILLGTWVLDRRTERDDLAQLICEELARFLEQGAHPERHKELLGDVLP